MTHSAIPARIRCLTSCKDSKGWRAVALEMDIWGFGETEEQARKDLEELVAIQVDFATSRNELSLLDHPADQKWFDLWDSVHSAGPSLANRKGERSAQASHLVPFFRHVDNVGVHKWVQVPIGT